MSVRSVMVESTENPEAKKYLTQFFDEVDRLFVDMEKLTLEEFKIRNRAMWDLRNKAMDCGDGRDFYIIDLFGFEEKAQKLFGNWNPIEDIF